MKDVKNSKEWLNEATAFHPYKTETFEDISPVFKIVHLLSHQRPVKETRTRRFCSNKNVSLEGKGE